MIETLLHTIKNSTIWTLYYFPAQLLNGQNTTKQRIFACILRWESFRLVKLHFHSLSFPFTQLPHNHTSLLLHSRSLSSPFYISILSVYLRRLSCDFLLTSCLETFSLWDGNGLHELAMTVDQPPFFKHPLDLRLLPGRHVNSNTDRVF